MNYLSHARNDVVPATSRVVVWLVLGLQNKKTMALWTCMAQELNYLVYIVQIALFKNWIPRFSWNNPTLHVRYAKSSKYPTRATSGYRGHFWGNFWNQWPHIHGANIFLMHISLKWVTWLGMVILGDESQFTLTSEGKLGWPPHCLERGWKHKMIQLITENDHP